VPYAHTGVVEFVWVTVLVVVTVLVGPLTVVTLPGAVVVTVWVGPGTVVVTVEVDGGAVDVVLVVVAGVGGPW